MEGDWDPELPRRKLPDKYHIELQREREINILCVKHLKSRGLSVTAVSITLVQCKSVYQSPPS